MLVDTDVAQLAEQIACNDYVRGRLPSSAP